MDKLFRCPHCGKKGMKIFRFLDIQPLGVCGHCECAIELTTEDLITMSKISKVICDRPGCGKDIPDGTGKKMSFKLTNFDDTEPVVVSWDLCDDCTSTMNDMFTRDEGLVGAFTRAETSAKQRAAWERRKARENAQEPGNPNVTCNNENGIV